MNNQQNDDMDRQTLNVAFATQKGGSGKTAITVLVAGYRTTAWGVRWR